ncbi:MAG: virulence-associated E family protein [Eubacteriales bacterium]|jgi:predicted P-loop ATPase
MALLNPEMTVEEVMEMLELGDKGRIRNVITNAELILSYDPLLRGALRYNELTQRIDVVKPLGWERGISGAGMNDNDLNNIHLYCARTYGFNNKQLIKEAVNIVANRNPFHPVQDFLNSLEWDGTPRVRHALHHFLGADESDYTYEILKFFMLGAISRVFRPGVKFDYIICVVGDQGAGKSTFFRLLAIEDEWFTDDLKDLESGKVYEKLQGHWIIELSEMLATNNAKSNEAIKSFLFRQKEIYRTPYERYPKDRPRKCVFAGTTNKISFLPNDRTGNRRFLPISCQESEAEVFILDNEKESREYIRQMWAEVMEIWRSGKVRLKLAPEIVTEVRQRQRKFMQEDVDSGLILAFMQDFTGDKVCSKQLFREALHNDSLQPARWQTNEINDIMNQLIRDGSLTGWRYFDSPRRFGSEYGSQKGWERVPDVNEGASTNGGFHPVMPGDDISFPF